MIRLWKNKSYSTNCSKIIKKVKVSDRITELRNFRQDKNNMTPIFDHGGIKIVKIYLWNSCPVNATNFCVETVNNMSMLNLFCFKKADFSEIREILDNLLLKPKEIAICLIWIHIIQNIPVNKIKFEHIFLKNSIKKGKSWFDCFYYVFEQLYLSYVYAWTKGNFVMWRATSFIFIS